MILGAILDTALPRRRIEPALPADRPSAPNNKSDKWRGFFKGRLSGGVLLDAVAWAAIVISLAICFIAFFGALHVFDAAAEHQIVRFIDHNRLLPGVLILGSQFVLVLAIVTYGGRSHRLNGLLSEAQRQITYAIGAEEIGVWRWNAENGQLWLTDQAKEILKLMPAAAYDPASIATLIHRDDLPRLRDAIINAGKSDTPFDVDIRLASQNGELPRWLRCRGRSQLDGEGHIARIGGTLVDISDRVAMQTEIDRQRQSIIHLSRVGTVGKLSGALAHELSQPLTAIMHNAHAIDRMLRQKPVNIAEIGDAISDIIEDDSRVRDVIRHLRALLKKDDADFGQVDMTLLIHKVLGLVRKELALHRIKPVVAIAQNFPPVWGDEVQLQQLLLNLIMNAVDAIESKGKQGGTLSITVDNADGPGGAYHLSISDTGGGFQPGVAEKLFEPFFSTKKQGLGLGLSISEAIVRGHNGSIRAENNAEGGASFHISLPVTGKKPA